MAPTVHGREEGALSLGWRAAHHQFSEADQTEAGACADSSGGALENERATRGNGMADHDALRFASPEAGLSLPEAGVSHREAGPTRCAPPPTRGAESLYGKSLYEKPPPVGGAESLYGTLPRGGGAAGEADGLTRAGGGTHGAVEGRGEEGRGGAPSLLGDVGGAEAGLSDPEAGPSVPEAGPSGAAGWEAWPGVVDLGEVFVQPGAAANAPPRSLEW
ncbi:hypothetical protein T484DRAFT_1841495 [Baffinella frigidus]|nr:hypothetical protein T484DRAFT_1841495 [Cryptophyta sp. CCMP2293]